MIVVDSSALCAVFFNEPEKSAFQDILDGEERCVISAVNAHETACVLRGEPRRIDDAIRSIRMIVEGYRPAPGKI